MVEQWGVGINVSAVVHACITLGKGKAGVWDGKNGSTYLSRGNSS